jgi:hypothetical protein
MEKRESEELEADTATERTGSNNIVEVMGFQFERVHSNVIAWLLRTDDGALAPPDRARVLASLLRKRELESVLCEATVSPSLELAIGRKRRIDLVLFVRWGENRHAIVIEAKTDSVVSIEQLVGTREDFELKHPGWSPVYYVMCLGAGQFTVQQHTARLRDLECQLIDTRTAIGLFAGCSPRLIPRLYDDWIQALSSEVVRSDEVEKTLSKVGAISDSSDRQETLRSLGYRTGFPLYYTYYNSLRRRLAQQGLGDWSIYSGGNNPVMNWNQGCAKNPRGPSGWRACSRWNAQLEGRRLTDDLMKLEEGTQRVKVPPS